MDKTILSPAPITNETLRTIYERRAVRKFKKKPVEPELIETIIDAGRMAPSAINQQSWKFYVITDKALIDSFSREIVSVTLKGFAKSRIKNIASTASHLLHFAHGFDFHALKDPVFHGAPAVIFITGPKDNEWAHLDIGMCAQNMMLAAKSMGLDSCPIGFAKYVQKTKLYPKLEVPDDEEVIIAVILGYGDESTAKHERKKNNIIYIH